MTDEIRIPDEADRVVIYAIAERACSDISWEHYTCPALADVAADIAFWHLHIHPLRLDDFLKADLMNFAHDIFGIMQHVHNKPQRFVPRFTEYTDR